MNNTITDNLIFNWIYSKLLRIKKFLFFIISPWREEKRSSHLLHVRLRDLEYSVDTRFARVDSRITRQIDILNEFYGDEISDLREKVASFYEETLKLAATIHEEYEYICDHYDNIESYIDSVESQADRLHDCVEDLTLSVFRIEDRIGSEHIEYRDVPLEDSFRIETVFNIKLNQHSPQNPDYSRALIPGWSRKVYTLSKKADSWGDERIFVVTFAIDIDPAGIVHIPHLLPNQPMEELPF